MRDIKELNGSTSSYELFTHVYWQIVGRRITTFSELVDYLDVLEEGPRKEYVLQGAFPLIREIHWGFFRELNEKTFPVLWNQLVIPHRRYPYAGELKRSITITDIYCAFIDIHGYTAFCQESGKNPTMLRLLDSCIENDVRTICRDHHILNNRARGDEIVMIGTSAYDVVNAVAAIVDYFGTRRLAGNAEFMAKRRRNVLKLPQMTVSAGIAGGRKYATLVVTSAGDLSGTAVNTASRLQSRANVISPTSSRILTTETVRVKYAREAEGLYAPEFGPGDLAFLDVGAFRFKGIDLHLSEIIVDRNEMHRLEYREEMDRFVAALKNDRWSDQVVVSLTDLVARMGRSMERDGLAERARRIRELFAEERDYAAASDELDRLAADMASVPGADHFVVLYADAVAAEYRRIRRAYETHIDQFTEKNRQGLLSPEENHRFTETTAALSRQAELRSTLITRIDPEKRRLLWKRLLNELNPSVDEALYLGK